MTPEEVIQRLGSLRHQSNRKIVTDFIISILHTWIVAARFDDVDKVLLLLNPRENDPDVLLAAVSITAHVQHQLLNRRMFVQKTRMRLIDRVGLERTNKLMAQG